MNNGAAAAAYKADRFENAPPLKLVLMMYEGALRFLDQAAAAHAAGDVPRFQERCLRAQAIVSELRLALDGAQAPELAANLNGLYLFAEGEIRAGILVGAATQLEPVRDVLKTLLDGWRRIEVSS
ncbi:MAG: flagellar export chaperone FliS [Planctomycetes bacterium]|nr:flagellar export chaperone FliS [Planctomycetota bacterium]